ncbi:uncharacterized protein LOC143281021 [Babylonia areolata]|uniref:uncharacterized protein LOC143281021 n=1 Tax=Babylonia areolata TaxID=304850 RepID=UPI003FD14611
MEDEITECPLDQSQEGEAYASSADIRHPARTGAGVANISAVGAKVLSSSLLRASGAVPKTSRRGTVQVFGLARPGIKDQSQGAQAQNRSHRSAVRPFFCCGSELSLVSLMDSVDLSHSNSVSNRAVICDGKQSLSDSEDNTSNHLLPHSYSTCADDYGAACGSGASIQTVCGTGKATGGTLVRRVKSDKRKPKKHFWSLRFGKKVPGGVKMSEMRKSVCGQCGSKKCHASHSARCDMVCEKGKACRCHKMSYQCPAAELLKRQGQTADRRASVAGIFPISGAEELLAGERSLDRTAARPRTRASCDMGNLMDHVGETPLSQLTSRLQRLNPGASLAEFPSRDPFEEYSPLMEFHGDFVAQDMVDAMIHTRIDFVHHLVPDLEKITSCSFYWGVIDRYEAERLLDKKREGTFLLRDSAQDDFLFSVSFRRYNRSLHARIEQWNHRFSFDVHDPAVYSADSVCGLIEHYKDSSRCLFFEPMLTDPLHRTFPFSLQHLARAVICNNLTRYDHISKLPLPMSMKTYLRYYHYKQKVCVRSFEEPSP